MTGDGGEWVNAIEVAALEIGDVTPVTLRGRRLALYDAADGLYATNALCTHGGADLCDGYFDGHVIECPLHQGCFDIRDGRALYAPATRSLKIYPARVQHGWVQVKL